MAPKSTWPTLSDYSRAVGALIGRAIVGFAYAVGVLLACQFWGVI